MSVADYLNARGDQEVFDAESNHNTPVVTKLELVDITETEDLWGTRTQTILTADIYKARDDGESYQEYALLLRRVRNRDGQPKSIQLDIRSPVIQAGIREVVGYYASINMDSDPITIDMPFAPLFHYKKELRLYAAHESRTQKEKDHMNLLIEFMRKNLQSVERAHAKLLPSELITQDILWTLFRPDDIVIARRDHFIEAYIVDTCSLELDENGKREKLYLVGRSWDYNGVRFGPKTQTLKIEDFGGNKKIRDLEFYPIAYHQESDGMNLKEKLIQRGLKWREIVDATHREYSALAWKDPLTKQADYMGELIPVYTNGRIILDYSSHEQANPQLATELSGASARNSGPAAEDNEVNGIEDDDPGQEGDESRKAKTEAGDKYASYTNDKSYVMTHDQALISPAQVRGFSLTEKIWAFFLVDEVKEIKWSPDSFAALELGENVKKAIKALVKIHGDPDRISDKFDDVVVKKGKGIVFLLTGPPGLGKTLTAESIAEETRKPLYAITSGELGSDVVDTDTKLRRIFTQAQNWNAIVLLDEADVFLAKRERADLERNAYVSIFLRLIEYYEGILFLTTNRVQEFDEAFQSRIHLTVHYHPLDQRRRAMIWTNLLKRAHTSGMDQEKIMELARKYVINGREIKNLISTAGIIADYDGVPMTEVHIDTIFRLNSEP